MGPHIYIYIYIYISIYIYILQPLDLLTSILDIFFSTTRQLLRIKTGAAALESLTFADLEAKKLADSVEEVPWPDGPGWLPGIWFDYFNEASLKGTPEKSNIDTKNGQF